MSTLQKAKRGEPVTIGVIGGSITQGAKASKPELRYGNQVADWWRKTFPAAKVEFVNAGIGATGSSYAALRASRDLLAHRPDFVVVEFAVNDGNTQAAAETLEGLLRQILAMPNSPAVALLFMMNQRGGNAQEWFSKVGRHYCLPMVSYRDALWPEIEAGRLQWTDISPDEVHPNDRGHAEAARWVNAVSQLALNRLGNQEPSLPVTQLPPPLLTDLYEHTVLNEAGELKPIANQGWTYDEAAKCWKSATTGSTIEFEIEGSTIFSMHFVIKGPMGRAQVTLDGAHAKTLDGWFNQTWGGYRQTNAIATGLEPTRHRVRFELLPEKSDGSDGHEFRILGLGAAGTR